MADMEVEAELFYSAIWNHARTYERDTVDARWGLPDEGVTLGQASCGITLDNRGNDYNPDDARCSLYGLIGRNTPARVTIDGGAHSIVDGVVSSWDPDRDKEWDSADPSAAGDSWTKISVVGPSQRVNASKSVKSALRRTMDAMIQSGTGPAGYWPMEGFERQPDVAPSAVPGVSDAAHREYPDINTVSAFDWQGDDTLSGSRNLPVLQSNLLGVAGIEAYGNFVPAPAVGAAFWTRTAIPETDESHEIHTAAIEVLLVDSGSFLFQIRLDTYPPGSTLAAVPANGEVQAIVNYVNNDTGTLVDDVTIPDLPFADGWRHMYARLSTSGSDVAVSIMVDGEVVGTGTLTGASLGTRLTRVTMNATAVDGLNIEAGRIAVGHPVVLLDSTTDMDAFAATHYRAGLGYPGEASDDRYLRLLDEVNIPGSVYGSDARSMGPQLPDTLPNLLLEIARTEVGLIYDKRDEYKLELRLGRTLYSQTAALALTYGVNVHPPIKPVTDNLNVANDITATARSGAVARVERTSGPLNVNDPVDDPEGITRIEGSSDVNPASDADLLDIAGFLLTASTWPGARYRTVTVSLLKHPELLDDIMAMRPGDLITLAGLDADTISLLALGAAHKLRKVDHLVTFNCIPAGPYAVADSDGGSRVGSASSSLAADFDAGTDTSMSVAIATGGALWSTSIAGTLHVRVGGVVLNVTAISGTSSPQTFTVDAATVNGIERTLLASGPPSLTRVDVAEPVFVGL